MSLNWENPIRTCTTHLFMVVLLAIGLVGCGGSGGGGEVAAPALMAGVDQSTGRNPENVINSASANAVEITVNLGANSHATDIVTAILSDGTNSASASHAGTEGAGTVVIGPIDATPLTDGPISLTVTVASGDNLTSTDFGTILVKDTMPPVVPLAFGIPGSGADPDDLILNPESSQTPQTNPANVINQTNVASVTVSLDFPAESNSADLVSLIFSDGTNEIEVPQENVVPGGTVTFSNIDLSSLADGLIIVTARLVDVNENIQTVSQNMTKDTVVPGLSLGRIAMTMANAEGFITSASVNAIEITAAHDSTALATDRVSVRLVASDSNFVATATQFANAGGMPLTYTGIDASGLIDGPIQVRVTIVDANNNVGTETGSVAVKDTMLVVLQSAAVVSGSGTQPNIINASNSSNVVVALQAATANPFHAGDVIVATLSDGSTPTSASLTVSADGTTEMISGFSLAGLAQGNLSLTIDISDSNGNTTSFIGSAATYDSIAPAGHNSAHVVTTTTNPIDVINQTSSGAVQVDVDFQADSDASRMAQVVLSAGGVSAQSSFQAVPVGGGVMSFSNLSTAMLSDGSITLTVNYTDGADNTLNQAGTPAQRDTVIGIATAAMIDAGVRNNANEISSFSASNVQVSVTMPSTSASSDQIIVTLSDGTNTTTSAPQNAPNGAGQMVFAGLNATGLADGPIQVIVSGIDPAQNSFTTNGTNAQKDVVAPVAAQSAQVASGPSNDANQINSSNEDRVSVLVRFGPTATLGDLVEVSLLGTSGIANSTPATCQGPDTNLLLTNIDARNLPDGPVQLRVTVTDTFGNRISSFGSPATKNTSAVAAVSATIVGGAFNPANYINLASASTVQVDVVMPSESLSTDSVVVRLQSGATTAEPLAQNAPNGGGTMSFLVDASSLADGNVLVTVLVTGAGNNMSTFHGTPAIKDTVAPAAPTGAVICSNVFAPPGYINAASVADVCVEVQYASGHGADETVEVSVQDGVIGIDSTQVAIDTINPFVQFLHLDCSTLQEGALTLRATITDAAGNATFQTFSGSIKDTVPPVGATALTIPGSAFNPADVINSQIEGNVTISITNDASADIGEEVTAVVTDGTINVALPLFSVTAPGAKEFLSSFDASSFADGAVMLQGSSRDLAGNVTTWSGFVFAKDTQPPAAPQIAWVDAGAFNPAGFINIATAGSVTAAVQFGPTSVTTDDVTVSLSDGSSAQVSMSQSASNGIGTIFFNGIDASRLADGPIVLQVTLTDINLNSTVFTGNATTKDTVAPDVPTSLSIAAIPGTVPADYINAATQSSAGVALVWPGTTQGDETFSITLDDGTTQATSTGTAPVSGGAVTVGIDASMLAEGNVAIAISVDDPAGNSAVFVGTPATKDTIPPHGAASGQFAMSSINPANVVNFATASAAVVDVVFPGGSSVADLSIVRLSDGTIVLDSTPQTSAPGTVSFTLDASSLSDGALTVDVISTDPAGNVTTLAGTAGLKDTVAPDAATMLRVLAGLNNPVDYINQFTQGAFDVSVTYAVTNDPTDIVTITATDGATSVATMPTAVGAGGTASFTLSAAGFIDGAISFSATIEDVNQNLTVFVGTSATLDTIAPDVPTAAAVSAGANNAASIINILSAPTVTTDITWPGTMVGDETYVLTYDDGAASATVNGTAPASGGAQVTPAANLSGLADGTVTLTFVVTDPAGNTAGASGTPATLDLTPPSAPIFASVMTTSFNPVNVINGLSETSVMVELTWDNTITAMDTALVRLSDGTLTASSSSAAAVPSGMSTYAIDASSLSDGAITLSVEVTDVNGNVTTSAGTAATKETVPPGTPNSAVVAAGMSNAINIINANNASAVVVSIDWPMTVDVSDTFLFDLSDGFTSASSGPQNPTPGATQTVMIDASMLADGPITISGNVFDVNGNLSVFVGTNATKDVVPPVNPTSASVAAGMQNATDVINSFTFNNVTIDVAWPMSANSSDSAIVTLSDGTLSVDSASVPVIANTTVGYVVDTTTLADGAITVTVTSTDAAGNTATFAGTAATKDIVGPDAPSALSVPMTASNPLNVINANTETMVGYSITFAATANASENFVITLSDGTTSVSSTSASVSPNMTVTGMLNATTLADGPVSIGVTITDTAGNETMANGGAITKDVVLPAAATAVNVASGTNNAVNIINNFSVASTMVSLTFGASSEAGETYSVNLSDGSTSVMATGSVVPNSTVTSMVNTSSLMDGAITLTVTITDVSGNGNIFLGTAATKDTVDPTAPTSAAVAMDVSNAANFINSFNETSVSVTVAWPMGASAMDTAIATLSDGTLTLTSSSQAPNPGGSTTYTFNSATLADGAVTVAIRVDDANGNQTTFNGTAATKDVLAPDTPTAMNVAAGMSNAINVINVANVMTASVAVVWPGTSSMTDSFTISISDGSTTVSSMSMNPTPGATQNISLDASTLNDTTVSLSGSIQDAAGNIAVFVGTNATKDATAPTNPTAAAVAMGMGNAADIINVSSVSSAVVSVTWPMGANAADSATVTLSDGGMTVTSSAIAVNPGNTVSYTINASGLADGAITMSVDSTDAAGNTNTFAGTAATKDTVAPAAPTALSVPMTMANPANFINAATLMTGLSITFPAGSAMTDTFVITASDGSASVSTMSTTVTPSMTVTPTLDTTTLADGAVSLVATVTDTAGNTATFNGTAVTKDVVAPVAPSSASIAAGTSNAVNIINSSNVSTATVALVFGAMSVSGDSLSVTLGDGMGSVNTTGSVVASSTVNAVLNASSLTDGAISISVDISDAAGNTTSMSMGTAATKDTVAPTAPSSASIPMAGMTPANTISSSTAGAVSVTVAWPGGADAMDSAVVRLSDGTNTASAVAANPDPGMSTMHTINASGLNDGAITVSVIITDVNGNTTTFGGTAATKDATSPVDPTSATVAMGMNNAASVINDATDASVTVAVVWPAGADATATAIVSLTDGMTTVMSSGANPTPGMTQNFTVNASTLNDGAISVSVGQTDPASNTSTFAGTAATKDVVAPNAPGSASVIAGTNNGADVINTFSVTSAMVQLAWGGGQTATDTYSVTLSDGGTTVVSSGNTVNPGGNTTVSLNASTLAEGAVAVLVVVSDLAGNTTNFMGTAATKDTTLPVNPTSAHVAAGMSNPIDYVNTASVAAVQVDVAFGAMSEMTETATVTLTNGVQSVTSMSQNVTPSMTVNFTGLDLSTFNQGNVSLSVAITDVNGNVRTFNGTTAVKDTQISVPTAMSIAAGMTNAVNIVNDSNDASASVSLTWPVATVGDEDFTITISDGMAMATAMGTAPAGGGSQTVSGIDLSMLADGALTLSITATDTATNSGMFSGTAATKDVVAPAAASSAAVAMGGGNAANVVNVSNASAAAIGVAFGAMSDAMDTFDVTISDGSASVTSTGNPVIPSMTVSVSPNLSSLADGALTITVVTRDVNGNTTSAMGTAATKDATAPIAPTSASVNAGMSNAANIVNTASVMAVSVGVVFPGTANAADMVTGTLSDGSVTVNAAMSVAVTPSGTSTLSFDASTLADGNLTLSISVTDTAGNTTTFGGTAATKDTVAPTAPTSAFVAAGTFNSANVINATTVNSVPVSVVFGAGSSASDTFTVALADGMTSQTGSSTAVVPSSTVSVSVPASSLAEGAISVVVNLTDTAGNTAQYMGTAATKDVTTHPAPTSSSVAAGMSNAANLINTNNLAAVMVDVAWSAMAEGTASATVSLSDGSATVTSSAQAPSASMTVSYSLDATTLADGAISVSVTVTDVNGNATTYSGTAATKDTVPPVPPTSASVAAGMSNAANFITSASVATVQVSVVWPMTASAADTATVSLSDGSVTVTSGSMNPNPGNTVTYSVNASTLADGAITVAVNVTDINAVPTNFSGTAAQKDTTAPTAPSSASVAVGSSNTVNYISQASQSAAMVDVVWPGGATASDSATVTLSDGTLSATSTSQNVSPGMTVTYSVNATTLAQGAITVTVNMTDTAGNTSSFNGTAATKDTVAPTGPNLLQVPASLDNPANFVNSTTAASANFAANWPTGTSNTNTVTITATDILSATVTRGPFNAPNSATTSVYTVNNLSALADGTITLQAVVTDVAGNTTTFNGINATKDTVAPAPSSAIVAATMNNAANFINAASASAVASSVTFPGSEGALNNISMSLNDGTTTLSYSTTTLATGGGTVNFTGLNASTLIDGNITVTATARDTARNVVTYGGTAAVKDVTGPSAPTGAEVAMTASNPANFVNSTTASSATITVSVGAGSLATDTVTASVSDGSTTLTFTGAATAGAGTVTLSGSNLSSLNDGALTVSAIVTDQSGNPSSSAMGTAATKDTVAPSAADVDPVTSPTGATTQVITGIAPASHDVVVSGGAAQASATADSNGHYAVTVTLTADATNTLSVQSRDAAGNLSTAETMDFYNAALSIVQSTMLPASGLTLSSASVGVSSALSTAGGSFADIDIDGDLDLFVASASGDALYQYDNLMNTYTDITVSAGITSSSSQGGVFGDFDNDGDRDLLVASATGVTLWRNDAVGAGTVTFTDVSSSEFSGITGALTQVLWLDFDNDGWLDFLVLNNGMSDNYLMINQRGAMTPANSFARNTSTGIDTNVSTARFAAAADFDADGDVDVVIGDSGPSSFFRNDGGTFTDIAGMTSGVSIDHMAAGAGIVFADFDNDGDLDLFVCRGSAGTTNQLWRNTGASFTDVATAAGVDAAGAPASDVAFGDFNNDGFLDFVIGSSTGTEVWTGLGDTDMDTIFEFSMESANGAVASASLLAADYDRDGDIDIFEGSSNSATGFQVNGRNNYRYLLVDVVGNGVLGATDGLGAIVYLKDSTGATILASREVSGGNGRGSQDSSLVHFGGVIPSQDYMIEVHFTSGQVSTQAVRPRDLAQQSVTIFE